MSNPEKAAPYTTKNIAVILTREEMEHLQVLFFLKKGVESLLTAFSRNPPSSYQCGIPDFHRLSQQFI